MNLKYTVHGDGWTTGPVSRPIAEQEILDFLLSETEAEDIVVIDDDGAKRNVEIKVKILP